jgi:predicted Holliday junction resolvase-like endonuclease
MTIVLGLVTTLLTLALGFVLGRIWEIRRDMLSRPQSIDEELKRQRRAEDILIRKEVTRQLSSARR